MSNRRLYYACYAVGIASFDTNPTSFLTVRGLQTAGINTTFNLEQVFEIGQLAIYENIENIPDVEVSLEKVLDGSPLIYHLCTQNAAASTLVGRSNQRANVAVSFYSDTNGIASGTPLSQCIMSGVYVSQVSYQVQVDGNARESVTLVGNNKVWRTGSFTFTGFTPTHGVTSLKPADTTNGVNRRQEFVWASSVMPNDIRGIVSGVNPDLVSTLGMYTVSVQSIRVSASLGREQLLELGRNAPYFRYIRFPVEVTCDIEIIAKNGDFISATEEGVFGNGNNLQEQTISFMMKEGLKVNLGASNKLQSVSFGGGDAGGDNATITYSYVTYNDFDIKHSADPTVALR